MNILIIADEIFATRERSLLTRLEVGLADEGHALAYAVPQSVIERTAGSATELSGVFSRVVAYTPSSISFTRRLVVRRLVEALDALPGDWERIDAVHVFGGSAWELASGVAIAVEAPLVVECWRRGLGTRARELWSGPRAGGACPTLFLASDTQIEREMLMLQEGPARTQAAPAMPVRCVPWGVLSPEHERAPAQGLGVARPANIMFIGSGRRAAGASGVSPAWEASLGACADIIAEGFDLLLYADDLAAGRAGTRTAVRALSLLSRLSLIDELEGRRDLMLHGDILILPEATHEVRSIVLEAMAAGMLIVSAEGGVGPMLEDRRTALLVPATNRQAWREAIHTLLTQRAIAVGLADAAHLHVQVHRKASDYIRGVITAYEHVSGTSLRLKA